ncbi:Hsp70 family protein [Cyanobium sp. NIES-981]|uniref:Hsp70 family protein n=1 Tax=Cyanobium sp. NIES-981 TaxID=1851505 RepID=UPI0007DDEABF|nr:Hsp70 family protein [Cyanobium sp. NIES-981]SBO44510.1 DnaK family protein [Cyanobium sp. NIES-981]
MVGTLAIDLGSTTTVVAFQPPGGQPGLVALPPYSLDEPPVVPSLVWMAAPDSPRPLLGRQVLEAGLVLSSGPELHRDFKRRIGLNPPAPAGLPLSPEAAAALLLQHIWRSLPAGLEPSRLVLTAPVEGYRNYRSWLVEACRDLEVAELALVDEPTAAAIGAGLPAGSTVLVVDVGGGTIDLSLVRLEGGEGRAMPIAQLLRFAGRDLHNSRQALRCAQVIGKAGVAIGGRDIDRWIAQSLCPPAAGASWDTPALLDAAEQLKCRLSESDEARVIVAPPGRQPLEWRLTRRELDALLQERGLLAELDALLEQVLAAGRRAGIGLTHIAAVLPVGGGSRLGAIRAWLESRCSGVAIRAQRPVEAVALGALALTPGVQVRDVLSHGVSLRCWEQRSGRHHWHPLFMAGQSWPTDQPLELVLACSRDGQTALELVLGEPRAEERREVVFEAGLPVLRQRQAGSAGVEPWPCQPRPLELVPPGCRGQDRLQLAFGIDGRGRLMLAVTDLLTGERSEPRDLGAVR